MMGSQPLAGLRVLDFAHLLPGEFAAFWLGQLGAEVIKVERPGTERLLGIDVRHPFRAALNRGKKSVLLDLKKIEDREVARKLVARADVLIEGFRPGVMARLGLGWEDVHALNPRLVYCSISGFGQDGPDRKRPGHDNIYLAEAGLLTENRGADGEPHLFPVQLADVGGGTLPALVGILAALWAREQTGEGTYVDVSMFEGALAWTYLLLPSLAGGPETQPWLDGLAGRLPCYGIYKTKEGEYVALGALEPHFWAAFCQSVGREEWLGRAYDVNLREEVAALFRQHTLDEWLGEDRRGGILDPQTVPTAALRSLDELVQDECLWEEGFFVRDEYGRIHPSLPLRLNGRRPATSGHVPGPGENNNDIEEWISS